MTFVVHFTHMKDDFVSLRLPKELARALTRWARTRRVPKSAIVREAVARYLGPAAPPDGPIRRVTGGELAALLASLPRLSPEEVNTFARDLARARSELAAAEARDPWES